MAGAGEPEGSRIRAGATVRRRRQLRLERVSVTKAGVGFILVTVVVAIAAANTGNNALYLVDGLMLALMVVSGLASRRNLQAMTVDVELPDEIFAGQPVSIRYRVKSSDRWFPKRYLLLSGLEGAEPRGIPFLAKRGEWLGRSTYLSKRRGRYPLPFVRIASSFPLGLFIKTMHCRVDQELLVFPEIHPTGLQTREAVGVSGELPNRRRGWGHELHELRPFREGDDPRGVHWKQSARTGRLIYMERETEEQLRLSIRFDNAVGELDTQERSRCFERLVSEAASASLHHLERGFELELVTRDGVVPFGSGRAHRLLLLERLAEVSGRPLTNQPMAGGTLRSPSLRLAMAGAG